MKYILDGHRAVPCEDIFAWGAWMESGNDVRRVALTEVTEDITVSTVFLGIDHSFGDRRPQLFETMVFGGALEGEQERYSTWEEAEAGHAAIVARARASL